MARNARHSLLGAALLSAWLLINATCRADDLPAMPPPLPPTASAGPATALATDVTAPYYRPPGGDRGTVSGPPACIPSEDCNGPLLRCDPLLDRPDYPPPGWFTAMEADIVKPHVKYGLSNSVEISMPFRGMRDFTDSVTLPMPALDWTGSPRLELGYRFAEGWGEILATYRSMASDGSAILPGFDPGGDAVLKGHLDVNVVDIDYCNREYALGPNWDFKWAVGLQIATVFMDSRAEGLFLEQRSRDRDWGIGPHVNLQLWRLLGLPGLWLYGKVESSVVVGQVHQGFEENVLAPGTGLALAGGTTTVEQNQAVPVLQVQAGLSWAPWECRFVRVTAGYQIESWWYVGEGGGSHAQLTDQGAFIRGEWKF